MKLFTKKAQSTAEYAIVIALVIGAAVAMQVYVRRSISGGLKFATDKLKSSDAGTGQYEPYYLQSETTTQRSGVYSQEQTLADGQVARQIGQPGTDGETTTRFYEQTQGSVVNKD